METPCPTPDTTTEQPLYLAAPGMSDALLYENLSRMLLHMARGLTRTLQDAEDLVQQTLAKLWAAQTRGASKESVAKMARTTLTRTWIDGWRKGRKDPGTGAASLDPTENGGDDDRPWDIADTDLASDTERIGMSAGLGEELRRAMAAHLSPEEEACVVLRGAFGYEHAEIAAIVGPRAGWEGDPGDQWREHEKYVLRRAYPKLRADAALAAWYTTEKERAGVPPAEMAK